MVSISFGEVECVVTYAAAVGDNGWEGVMAYAAEAVDCDGFFAGVGGAGASVHRQAVEG